MANESNDVAQQQGQALDLDQGDNASSRVRASCSQHSVTSSVSSSPERAQTRQWWKFKLRPPDDEDDQ